MGRPLRADVDGGPRRARHRPLLADPPCLLRHHGRPALAPAPDALAPLRTSAWSAATWGLLAARRPVLAAGTLAAPILMLAHRLRGLVDEPLTVASRIAGGGTARSALPALSGLTRAWSPALVLGLLFGRTRRAAALALMAPALNDLVSTPGDLDPVRYTALHVADDLAYGVGLWRGCLHARTLRPLIPHIVSAGPCVVPVIPAHPARPGRER